MRLSAIAADDSRIGLITENGNMVGADHGPRARSRSCCSSASRRDCRRGSSCSSSAPCCPARFLPLWVSLVLLALGSAVVIDPGNPDFTILGNRALNVAMFAALFPAFGCGSVWLAERFDRWLVQPPLVRLCAARSLAGTAGACLLGVLGIGVLARATGPIGGSPS